MQRSGKQQSNQQHQQQPSDRPTHSHLESAHAGCTPNTQPSAAKPAGSSASATTTTTFLQGKDPLEAEDWLRSIEKKLEIAQCTDQEKVLFAAHQLFGTATEWWEMYHNSHQDDGAVAWNKFKAQFRTPYIPRGPLKLKKKEFSELQQDGMIVIEYLNKFTQMSCT
jgi:hypothetical protein